MDVSQLTPEQRQSPVISNIDGNVASIMANAGYGNISVPPGMTANPNQDAQGRPMAAPQQGAMGINPTSSNQHIEPNYSINTAAYQNAQQPVAPQAVAPGQSIAGRGSPYAAHLLAAQENIQQHSQPVAPQVPPQAPVVQAVNTTAPVAQQFQFVTGADGNLSMQPIPEEINKGQHPQLQAFAPETATQKVLTPAELLAAAPAPQAIPQQQAIPVQNGTQQNIDPAIQAELNRMRAETDTMRQMLIANNQPQAQQQQAPNKSDESPKLADYIKELGDNWDENDGLKPSTASGAAYAKWIDARDSYKSQQIQSSVLESIKQQETQNATQAKIDALAANNPSFQDVYGRADVQKVKTFWDNVHSSDWGKLKQALDMVNGGTNGATLPQQNVINQSTQQMLSSTPTPNGYQAPAPAHVLNAPVDLNPNLINHQANQNMIPLHTGAASATPMAAQTQLPKSIQSLQQTYGTHFELPGQAVIR